MKRTAYLLAATTLGVFTSCKTPVAEKTFSLRPQATENQPKPEIIEAFSPLAQKSADLHLPLRIDLSKKKELSSNRLAERIKSSHANPASLDKKINLNLKLDNAEISTVIEAFKEQLHFDYILDPSVKGNLKSNINLENTLSTYDCWSLFEQVLYLCDAYVVSDGKVLRIMPLSKLKQENLVGDKSDGLVSLELFHLVNADAALALTALQPFLSKGASASVLPKSNSILLIETSANLSKIKEILQVLDEKGQGTWPQIAYSCRNVNAAVILQELQTALPVLGINLAAGADKGYGVKIASLDRLQVIVASAANQPLLAEIQKWIEILDSADSTEGVKIFNYPVQHCNPDDLLKAVSLFFPNTNSTSSSRVAEPYVNNSSSSRAGQSSFDSTRPSFSPSYTPYTPPVAAAPMIGKVSTEAKSGSLYDQSVTIYQDNQRNQLMIRTNPRTFSMMKAILQHLDAPPLQVIIQVTAVEIDLNDSLEYGFEFAAKRQFGGNEAIGGIGSPATGSKFGPAGDVTPGVNLLFQRAGVDNEFAFVKAVAGETSSRLLFCPHIQTLNDQPAELNIGQSVPTRRGSNSSEVGFQDNIDYRDTGVILRVNPQITSDLSVLVTTEIEISGLSKDIVEGIESPIINNNTMKTRLRIKDGDTILLGGIITKNDSQTESGVPFLKDIPLLGYLFKGGTKTNNSKELVLFVKVSVVQSSSDIEKMMKRYQKSVDLINQTPGIP